MGTTVKRIPAFAADYGLIAFYALGLAGMSVALGAGNSGASDTAGAKLAGWAVAFVTLTLPVALASAAFDRAGGTPGKRLLGLRVQTAEASPLPFGRALLRNGIKYAPWELAHIGIWTTPGTPFTDPPGPLNFALWIGSMALMALQAVLILITGRGLHDRLARSQVTAGRRPLDQAA